jgi:hypothetical protein
VLGGDDDTVVRPQAEKSFRKIKTKKSDPKNELAQDTLALWTPR